MEDILHMVRRGQQVTLTKDGEVVARVLPPALTPFGTPVASPEERRAAIDRFLESAKGQTLGGLRIKDLISEGRR